MSSRRFARLLATIAAASCAASAQAETNTAYGITSSGSFMVRFDVATPGTLDDIVAFTGLQSGERIAGIDFRPRTGQLFGLGVRPVAANDEIRIYRIDPATGAAELVTGTPFTILTSAAYGVSFNPTSDRIRVVNDVDDNLRINPFTGARADSPTPDTNVLGGPVSSVAYDRAFEASGDVFTTAYVIEGGNVCTLGGIDGSPSANTGQILNCMSLGAAGTGDQGLEITAGGDAFAAVTSGGTNRLFSVNLSTGAGTPIGDIGGGNLAIGGLAIAPQTVLALGAEAGFEPRVRLLDGPSAQELVPSFQAFDANVRRGVRVAVGDVTRDGMPDVLAAPGKGAVGEVRVFDGTNGALVAGTTAFEPTFKGGVYVAAGDVNGDGFSDAVVGRAGGGSPDVSVLLGPALTPLGTFPAYDPTFKGGVTVATADFDLDGVAEIVTGAGKGGLPAVRVFDAAGNPYLPPALPGFVDQFLAYTDTFRKGVFVAAGDVNGDGTPDVVVGPGKGSPPEVAVFSGADGSELRRFLAFDAKQRGGVRVAVGDVDSDGRYEVIATLGKGAKGGTVVRAFDGATAEPKGEIRAFDERYRRGVFVAGVRR